MAGILTVGARAVKRYEGMLVMGDGWRVGKGMVSTTSSAKLRGL